MPRIDDVLVVLQPMAVLDKPTESSPHRPIPRSTRSSRVTDINDFVNRKRGSDRIDDQLQKIIARWAKSAR
jgi:hypothetical protein